MMHFDQIFFTLRHILPWIEINASVSTLLYMKYVVMSHPFLRGHSTFFFSGRGVQPWFLKCRACKLLFARRGSCELKISKIGVLRAKIWAKIEAVWLNFQIFFQQEVLWTETFLKKFINLLFSSFALNGTLENYRRGMTRRVFIF